MSEPTTRLRYSGPHGVTHIGAAARMQEEARNERPILGIASAQLRVLALRFSADDLRHLTSRHLVYGLLVVWAAGLGRYWDHPDPYLFQVFGLSSLVVAAGVALLLYGLLLPLRPARWSFAHLLTFVCLTALPAVLYAIPVERFMDLDSARVANVWFLAVVAVWRVAMLGRYLSIWTDLSGSTLWAALLLPLTLVVVILTALNLERAVFDVMSGLRPDGTANDAAYRVLFVIATFSMFAAPFLALLYGFAIWRRSKARRAAAQRGNRHSTTFES